LKKHVGHIDDLRNRIEGDVNAGYVHLTEEVFQTRTINVITGTGDAYIPFAFKGKLKEVLARYELAMQNIAPEDIDKFIAGYAIGISPLIEEEVKDPMYPVRKWTPPIFAMIIFFMVFGSGMTTMQSAISDKRDKMIEILLSSISTNSLMYGKVIGNFVAGLIQVAVFLIYALMFLQFVGFPGIGRIPVDQLLSFVVSPQLPLLLLFALLGYLLFSSIYAGLGATMEDVQNAGNFQGIAMLLPALSFLFISPVASNPDGIIAQIGSYVPFTASVVMILRVTLTELNLVEIIIPIVILLVSTVLMAKLAGKIFRIGMLMYGKEADPKEIWKWVRQ
jgi:ABC-2 type transport system permease protein